MSLKIVIVSNYVKQICMTYLLTFESSNKARDSASTLLGETADVTLEDRNCIKLCETLELHHVGLVLDLYRVPTCFFMLKSSLFKDTICH